MKDLIKKLLIKESLRLYIFDALEHSWFKDLVCIDVSLDSLMEFCFFSKFKRIILSIISSIIPQNEVFDIGE